MSANFKLPKYTIYFDANIAYSKKPAEPVSAKLLTFVEKARALTEIDVRVPEVVSEELAYQQFVIALSAAENLKKNAKTLLDVSGLNVPEPPEEEALKTGVKSLLSKSLTQASFSTVATPTEKIDWAVVVQDSCWRRTPFEKPSSEDDLAEKGFRDKIILETIKVDLSQIKDGVVAFVSGDNRLLTAFKEHATTTKCPIETYSNLRELLGNLELLSKTQSKAFSDKVLASIGTFFYTPDNPDCIAVSKGLIQKLTEEYSGELSSPPLFSIGQPKSLETTWQSTLESLAPPTFSGNWFKEAQLWTPVSPVTVYVSPPVFQPNKGDGRYHWISKITLARLLRRNETRSYGLLPEERIRTKDIEVKWSCKIDPQTAAFSDPSVESYAPTFRDSFLEANFNTRTLYNLPLFRSFGEQNA